MALTLSLETNNNTQNTARLDADGSGVLVNVAGLTDLFITLDYTKGTETTFDLLFNVVFKNNPTKIFQLLSALSTATQLSVAPSATGKFVIPVSIPTGVSQLYINTVATGTVTGTAIIGVQSNGSATQSSPNSPYLALI